jgi:hypothetical protein
VFNLTLLKLTVFTNFNTVYFCTGVLMVLDARPYIEIKKARVARSGIQMYSADEIAMRGLKPKKVKDVYAEYRPPEILVKNLDKFNYVPMVSEPVTYHTTEDVTPQNWKDYAVGFIGGKAELEYCEDGNIYIVNDVIFYSEEAYNAYKNGRNEISMGYDVASVAVDDPDAAGYDIRMVDIPACNHAALCLGARAGRNARILDTANIINTSLGGTKMGKGSILSFLGIGKSKDSTFVLSKVVLDSIAKVGILDPAGLEKEIKGVVADYIAPLGDSEAKELLVGAVSDSFKHPVEVLAQQDNVAKVIDKLYAQCRAEDEKAAKAVLDSVTDTDKDKKPGDPKDDKDPKDAKEAKDAKDAAAAAAPAKDTAALIEEAVAKGITAGLAGVTDSIKTLVDTSVKDALGLSSQGKPTVSPAADSSGVDITGLGDFNPSFLMGGAFGVK